MERIVYRKTLDVHKNGIQFTLQGFETADNMARRIEISLMAGGDTIDLPMEQLTAMMYVTTPYAINPSINECTIKDNKIIYDVLPIVKEGITEMQLKLIETSIDGAKSVLATPRFAVEVTKGNADDEHATQTTTFTALEDAIAKANGVYESRLIRIEIDAACNFCAYFADGTIYETDALNEALYKGEALLSQSYARGGTGTRGNEDTDNSMYYSNVSRSASADVTRISNEATELLEEARKHGVYTTFSVDFETGEVKYISPNYKFTVNKDSGELDVFGGTYTADETIELLVQEWLTNKSASINAALDNQSQDIEKLNDFKTATGKLIFNGLYDGNIVDGDTNVSVEDISKYNVLAGVINLDIGLDYNCSFRVVLMKSGAYLFGNSSCLREYNQTRTFDKIATSSISLALDDGDTILNAKIKVKLEDDDTIYSAELTKLYGIC